MATNAEGGLMWIVKLGIMGSPWLTMGANGMSIPTLGPCNTVCEHTVW